MTITVLAPAFYDNDRVEWATRYLRISAEKHGVPIRWYGVGEPYRGWPQVQIHSLLDELRKVDTDHVLYTDSSDALFLGGLQEIRRKYIVNYGNPEILISVEADGVNMGGWMAQTQAAIEALVWIRDWQHDDNPQVRWRSALAKEEIAASLDVESMIFQVIGSGYNEPLRMIEGRPTNPRFHQPCLLHFAGGYTDPAVGKAAFIEPVWKELGYASTT